jgi:peptidase E
MLQIITMGGGGFSMEPDNLALDRYIVEQSGKPHPKVCLLPQASGESRELILSFYKAFYDLDCRPSWLSFFQPQTADIEGFLMDQDVIYVGGGNTKSMIAIWREWRLNSILRKAGENGTLLAGISAGMNCWFEYALSDSIPGQWIWLPCLGYLAGSCSPHYDGEPGRRPAFERMIGAGEIPDGIALDDGAAGHFVDGQLKQVVSSRPNAKGYQVEKTGDSVRETPLETHYLLA